MKSPIRRCSEWRAAHDRPVYTFTERCPDCGAPTENSAPPPFSPEDRYGEYRRRARRRSDGPTVDDGDANRE
ncbi:RNA-protein complex protein Nop10 [Halopenitus persicus]|uniref:RNA-protein complex protein Nop10 n=1 Tax=Halopenitus persicus TaxID=1048396 RepID=UPI000676A9F4|nr:RNA-protein complex protein Nop10 [Halopenitus persicus]QHS17101.1 RNA-protein complex protein Nop10 [haloarchaeon 3A1-DGR]